MPDEVDGPEIPVASDPMVEPETEDPQEDGDSEVVEPPSEPIEDPTEAEPDPLNLRNGTETAPAENVNRNPPKPKGRSKSGSGARQGVATSNDLKAQ
jgi:hypothetical protein